MIIDFHVHCFPEQVALKAIPELADRAGITARLDGTLPDLKNSMSSAGVDCSVILSIATRPLQTPKVNDWSAQIQQPGIIAFGSVHPDFGGWREELKRIKQLGLKGIKLHPDYQEFYIDEERMLPFYELAFELGLIIVFHSGVDIGLPSPYHCTPDRLRKLVRLFKGGRFVAAHLGGYDMWDDVEKLIAGEDIYLDTSYSLEFMSSDRAARIIRNHGYEKILFATDSPWGDQAGAIAKIKSLDLGDLEEKAVLGGNAKALLGL